MIERGLYLGFRKLTTGGTWIVRKRNEDGRQQYRSLGHADMMPYEDALKATRAWVKAALNAGIDPGDVETVEDACRAYVGELCMEKRESAALDAEGRFRRTIHGNALGKIKLSQLRTAKIKEWRAALDIGDASKNRTLTALKAALNLAVRNRNVDPGKPLNGSRLHRCP